MKVHEEKIGGKVKGRKQLTRLRRTRWVRRERRFVCVKKVCVY